MDRRGWDNNLQKMNYDTDRPVPLFVPPCVAGVGDFDIMLDVDFRAGEAAVDNVLVGGGVRHNFAKIAGGLWDAVKGWNPNGVASYVATNWIPAGYASRALAWTPQNYSTAVDEYTIYAEVERAALSATWMDDNGNFVDSSVGPSASCWNGSAIVAANHLYGDYTAGLKAGYVFHTLGAVASNFPSNMLCYQVTNTAGRPVGRMIHGGKDSTAGGGLTKTAGVRLYPTVPSVPELFDPGFVKIACVFFEGKLTWYIDGAPTFTQARGANPITVDDMFRQVRLGVSDTATQIFRGYIRRIQISRRAPDIAPMADTRVAFVGDSITQAGGSVFGTTPNNPNPLSIADMDGQQNCSTSAVLTATLDDVASNYKNPIVGQPGRWRPHWWMLWAMACAYRRGFYMYNANDPGFGFSYIINEISPWAYRAALKWDPNVVVITASPNDVSPGTHGGLGITEDELLQPIRALIASFVARCSNLKRVILVMTPPGAKGEGWTAREVEYQRQLPMIAKLDGYLGVTTLVDLYSYIGGKKYPAKFNRGGTAEAPLWDAIAGTSITGADLHPSHYGCNLIAEAIWPVLRDVLFHDGNIVKR